MKCFAFVLGIGMCVTIVAAQDAPSMSAGPYKVLNTVTVGGDGGWDYVYADSDSRRLYIPRGNRVTVFDLDTLKPVGEIPNTNNVHGVAVDAKSGHGFTSSRPVVMFDTKTLATLSTINADGRPDGITFDPASEKVFVLSHQEPNVTVINGADGSIAGTVNLGGEPEESVCDGNGHLYCDLENANEIAVVDLASMKVTAHYDLGGAEGPGGLAMDKKNGILFAFCHSRQAVVLNAADGKILATLPIGAGIDAAEFNPNTNEAFGSEGQDSMLTVIKESNPKTFAVEQNVPTKPGARTSTLDAKTGKIFLVTAQMAPPSTQPATQTSPGRRGRGRMIPGTFMIVVVGT
jgi:DNA-binding beta-propeller fold protein YncE